MPPDVKMLHNIHAKYYQFKIQSHTKCKMITNSLNPARINLFEKLTFFQLVKKFLSFMTPGGSLLCSQEPANGLSILRQINSVHTISYYLRSIFNIILPSTRRSSSNLYLPGFPTDILYALLIISCVLHTPSTLFSFNC
jgi:hypothetical protein